MWNVQHQAHFSQCADCAVKKQLQVLELFGASMRVGPGCLVRDQLCVRFENCFDNAQLIRAQRRTRFGNFDDGIRQHRRLHFRGFPN